jgi:hypothetical protein
VAARSACLAFYRLRDAELPMKRVRLFCWSHDDQPTADMGFVYMEPGRTIDEIDEIIDVPQYKDKVLQIMQCHQTQKHDYEWMLKKRGDNITANHFIVKD